MEPTGPAPTPPVSTEALEPTLGSHADAFTAGVQKGLADAASLLDAAAQKSHKTNFIWGKRETVGRTANQALLYKCANLIREYAGKLKEADAPRA